MNPQKFQDELRWLERQKSSPDKAAEYNFEQKDALWEEFKTLNDVGWKDLIHELNRRYSWLPKMNQFHQVLRDIEKEPGHGKVGRDIRHIDEPCNICGGLGIRWGVFKDKYDELRAAIARCSACRNAENYSTNIPTT